MILPGLCIWAILNTIEHQSDFQNVSNFFLQSVLVCKGLFFAESDKASNVYNRAMFISLTNKNKQKTNPRRTCNLLCKWHIQSRLQKYELLPLDITLIRQVFIFAAKGEKKGGSCCQGIKGLMLGVCPWARSRCAEYTGSDSQLQTTMQGR